MTSTPSPCPYPLPAADASDEVISAYLEHAHTCDEHYAYEQQQQDRARKLVAARLRRTRLGRLRAALLRPPSIAAAVVTVASLFALWLWAELRFDGLLVNLHFSSWALECMRSGEPNNGYYSWQLWAQRGPGRWTTHIVSFARGSTPPAEPFYHAGEVPGKPEPWR